MTKTILVTGGNRGIGRCIVQKLLELDLTLSVIIGCRSANDGDEAVAELKGMGLQGVSCLTLDITSDESIANAVKAVQDIHGKLDVLVNNAGIAWVTGSLRDQFAAIYYVNVISVAAMMDAFLPLLQKSSNPRIVNVSTSLGSIANRVTSVAPSKAVPYSVAKTALNMLGVQFQKSHPDIAVHAVDPGFCKTELSGYNAGARDPLEGANVAVVMSLSEKGKYEGMGYWKTVGDSMIPTPLPW